MPRFCEIDGSDCAAAGEHSEEKSLSVRIRQRIQWAALEGGMTAEITAPKQRGRPFPKGRSGNPQGRPPGARNAATVIAEQLLDGEAEALTRKAIDKAEEGDMTALRLCLDRVVPPRRERPVLFPLPERS